MCVFILVYVDDIIIMGSPTNAIDSLIGKLVGKFRLKDIGRLQFFLGMELVKSENPRVFILS